MPRIIYTTKDKGPRLARLIRARIGKEEWLVNLATPVHDTANRKWRYEAYKYDKLAALLADTGHTAETGELRGYIEKSKIIMSDWFGIFVTDHRIEEAQHA